MPQVPLAFESEGPNGNSVTKQLLNYHSPDLEKSVEWLNGSSLTVLSPDYHLPFSRSDSNSNANRTWGFLKTLR